MNGCEINVCSAFHFIFCGYVFKIQCKRPLDEAKHMVNCIQISDQISLGYIEDLIANCAFKA